MKKIVLHEVTLFSVTSIKIAETVKAMKYSMRGIEFGEVILFCHEKPKKLPKGIRYICIDPIESIEQYNNYILYKVSQYVHTTHMICMQWDGYIVNPTCWKNEFLEYDYIGALWPKDIGFRDKNNDVVRVGNGGASLRSKRLMDAIANGMLGEDKGVNEDIWICVTNRHIIIDQGYKIAPVEMAKYFSHERVVPEIEGIKPFMIHKWCGNNAQYPEFGTGCWKWLKKKILTVFIWLGVDKRVRKIR